jgi:hypothetical protein
MSAQFASTFLVAEAANSSLSVAAFLKDEQISGTAAQAVETAVGLGRTLKNDGLVPGTRPFDVAIHAGVGLPSMQSAPVSQPPKSTKSSSEDSNALLKRATENAAAQKKAKESADQALVASPKDPVRKVAAKDAFLNYRVALAAVDSLQAGKQKYAGPVTFFHTGVRLLSPFSIGTQDDAPGSQFLNKGDGSVSGFLEWVYSNRWAWNESRIKMSEADEGAYASIQSLKDPFNSLYWDFDTRLTYNFAKGKEDDATAMVGSGDFGLELTLTRHLFRDTMTHDWADGAGSFGLDFSYGLVTEKGSFDAHHRLFAGPSYSVSMRMADTGKWALLTTRIGYSKMESVIYKSSSSREIVLEHGDIPKFKLKDAVAFESELFYPLGKDATISLGTRIYGKMNPNPWTVYIGYSKAISALAKGLLPNQDDASASSAGGSSDGAGKETAPSQKGVPSSSSSQRMTPAL